VEHLFKFRHVGGPLDGRETEKAPDEKKMGIYRTSKDRVAVYYREGLQLKFIEELPEADFRKLVDNGKFKY